MLKLLFLSILLGSVNSQAEVNAYLNPFTQQPLISDYTGPRVQKFEGEEKVVSMSGDWVSKQTLSCVGGTEPQVRPYAILTLKPQVPLFVGDVSKMEASKKVKPFDCTSPYKENPDDFLFIVDYAFALLPPNLELVSREKQEKMEALKSSLRAHYGDHSPNIDFILQGTSSEKEVEILVDLESIGACNGDMLSGEIPFPEYFHLEAARGYLVSLEEDSFTLYFNEDLICKEDLVKMTFKKFKTSRKP